ncbi:hypothetical protein M9Y10_005323 [Tritrichomonas musculus]|uniref:Protein kinase domain-containing protein n=1 Tax=Tritrichomonas musculus TaxID=1915356 RepID=A0ABR2JM38_9EUKA
MISVLYPNSKRYFFKTNNKYIDELIASKFSFTIFTAYPDGYPNIYPLQDKSNIIIIDKQENLPCIFKSSKYFYVICFDYNLVLIEGKDILYIIFYLLEIKNSKIYCFTNDIPEELQNSNISLINDDNIFKNEIKNFEEKIQFIVSQTHNSSKNNINSFWEKTRRTIFAFLIKKAYSNSKFDVIYHCREIFSQKVTEMLVKKNEFIEIRKLGHETSDVALIYLIKHEKLCAIKFFHDPNKKDDLYKNELSIYRKISHPLIPRLIGTVEGYGYPCIIIDFLDGITLQKINKKKFSVGMKIKFFFEILVIFRYIHSEGYMYIDLKPNNIFIVGYSLIFLFDFDRMIHVSSIGPDKEIYREFGHYYVAPEIVNEKTNLITQKVDIYSIGKIIEFMFLENKCEEFSQDNSKLIEKIYSQCTNINPESRPNISRLIEIFYDCFFIKISKISEIDTIKSINNINSNESFSFLIFLAEYQNSHAQYFLGEFYEEGKYFFKDINKAIHYFLLDLIELDLNLKIQYLEFFAKQNHSEAQYKLGVIYYENPNLKDSFNESIHYLLLSANQNNVNAREKLKKIFFEVDLSKLKFHIMTLYLIFSSDEGISEAQYQLGMIYYENRNLENSINESIHYLLLSAKQNNKRAREKLKEAFEKVDLNKLNFNLKIKYLEFAAKENHPEAQYQLGMIYYENQNLENSINESIHYLLLSAKQNNKRAREKLKEAFEKVDLNKLNFNLKIKYLEFAAKENHPEAQYQLGIIYYENQNLENSIHYLLLSANQNNINAIDKLKEIFKQIDLNQLDCSNQFVVKLMIEYLEFLSKENISEAHCQLGVLYSEGKHVNRNFNKSFNYFTKGAKQNHAESQYRLGVLIYENYRHSVKSIGYLLLSAKQNYKKAKEKLKEIFNEINIDLKIQYLKFVAGENIPEAQYQLGILYLEGKQVNKDIQTSKRYLTMAAVNKHQEAQHLLNSIYSEEIHHDSNHCSKLASDRKTNDNKNNNKTKENNIKEKSISSYTLEISDIEELCQLEIKKREKYEEYVKYENNKVLKYASKNSDDNKNKAKKRISQIYNLGKSRESKLSTKESFSEKIINIIDNFADILYKEEKGEENIYSLLDIISNIIKENKSYINVDKSVTDNIYQWICEIKEKKLDKSLLVSNLKDFIIFLQKFFSNKLYKTAINYYDGKEGQENLYKSIDYFKNAANYGHVEAQYNLGIIFSEDKIIKRNIDEAIKYFSLASAQNHSESQYRLGMIYYNGNYVQRNIEKAIYNLLMAADRNHPESQYQLGMIYYEGKYITRDIEKTIHYLQSAAEQNHSESQYYLGMIYYENENLEKSINKSIRYLLLSAKQNNTNAKEKLKEMFEKGDLSNYDVDLMIEYLEFLSNEVILEA